MLVPIGREAARADPLDRSRCECVEGRAPELRPSRPRYRQPDAGASGRRRLAARLGGEVTGDPARPDEGEKDRQQCHRCDQDMPHPDPAESHPTQPFDRRRAGGGGDGEPDEHGAADLELGTPHRRARRVDDPRSSRRDDDGGQRRHDAYEGARERPAALRRRRDHQAGSERGGDQRTAGGGHVGDEQDRHEAGQHDSEQRSAPDLGREPDEDRDRHRGHRAEGVPVSGRVAEPAGGGRERRDEVGVTGTERQQSGAERDEADGDEAGADAGQRRPARARPARATRRARRPPGSRTSGRRP